MRFKQGIQQSLVMKAPLSDWKSRKVCALCACGACAGWQWSVCAARGTPEPSAGAACWPTIPNWSRATARLARRSHCSPGAPDCSAPGRAGERAGGRGEVLRRRNSRGSPVLIAASTLSFAPDSLPVNKNKQTKQTESSAQPFTFVTHTPGKQSLT